MLKIEFNPDDYEVIISGHADYGEHGKDIVCAAVSALYYTLWTTLTELPFMLNKGSLKTGTESDRTYLKCKPLKRYRQNIATVYLTIFHGFRMMAEEYPDNIEMIIAGEKMSVGGRG